MVEMTAQGGTKFHDRPDVVGMPPFLFMGAFLVVLLARLAWPLRIVEGSLLTVGLVLAAIGIGLAVWGRRTMVAAGTNVRPTQPALTIVTGGPFRSGHASRASRTTRNAPMKRNGGIPTTSGRS